MRRLLVLALALTLSPAMHGLAQRGTQPAGFNAERLALCQDSWLEWKDDDARMRAMAEGFQSAFERKADEGFFVPKTRVTVVGLPVLRAFPDSIGMAVGFSIILDAKFDAARKSVERTIGKSFKKCETGDHMVTCALELGDKKTLTLMSEDDPSGKETLVGCYYFYAKSPRP
jgi:hypothetical protein